MGLFGATWSYWELFSAICSYLEQFRAIWRYLEIFGAFGSYLELCRPFPSFPSFPTFFFFSSFFSTFPTFPNFLTFFTFPTFPTSELSSVPLTDLYYSLQNTELTCVKLSRPYLLVLVNQMFPPTCWAGPSICKGSVVDCSSWGSVQWIGAHWLIVDHQKALTLYSHIRIVSAGIAPLRGSDLWSTLQIGG